MSAAGAAASSVTDQASPSINPRTLRLLHAPILPLLLRMAWPNVLVMLAQASTGLIETWWVSKLGTDALAGMALVFPGVMLMQMIAGGAMGGGISSAIARALGGGQQERADSLAAHAIICNVAVGLVFCALFLLFGRPLYAALGGEGKSLEAALIYSNVVFGGNILLWLLNAFASIVRGTGNMLLPALVTCGGLVLLVPLSPLLIFGLGPFPALGIAGGGVALLVYNLGGALILGGYVLSGRNLARLKAENLRPRALRWPFFADILRVGAVAAVSSLQTNLIVALTTALVGAWFGSDAVAGYGTAARLEYLLIPLVFGVGAPLVALVGTSIGAGDRLRAFKIAFVGAVLCAAMTEAIGIVAAIWPEAWLSLFGADPTMLASGVAYLRAVGPFYGFFGLGLALYFASQGAGRLFWPLMSGMVRLLVAVGGGWLALRLTGSATWLFAALGAGLLLYGVMLSIAVGLGSWGRQPASPATVPIPAPA